jgi:6-phosphogluconolactonase
MQIKVYKQKADLMRALAVRVASELDQVISQKGRATLVVPGGTTPVDFFEILSTTDLNWALISVILTDERWVPIESPQSNTGLIQKCLLVEKAKNANYIGLYESGVTPTEGALILSTRVDQYLPIDVLVLGMGADMHTASLFPGAAELAAAQESGAPSVVAINPIGNEFKPRVSLSSKALLTASHTHVLIIGNTKKIALAKAQNSSIIIAPIAQFLPKATVHWSDK